MLLCPQIPNNTGNIGRTAMASGCRLHLIHPLAFDLSLKAVRRSGMDYWRDVDLQEHASWQAFLDAEKPRRNRFSAVEVNAFFTNLTWI